MRPFSLPLTAAIFGCALMVTGAAVPAFADAKGEVRSAYRDWLGLNSYHLDMRTPDGTSVTADFVKPDRFHTASRQFDSYFIGKTMYMKMGSGPWKKFPNMNFDIGAEEKTLAMLRDETSAQDLGPRTVDGALLHAYGVQSPTTGKLDTVFVDTAGHIERIEADKLIIRVSKINAPITINPPI